MSLLRKPHRKAFTLVELLVVIAIIGILIALLVPAVQAVRATARAMHCRSNLRQMVIASKMYETNKGHLPPGVIHEDNDFRTGMHSGFTLLLPYIEQQNLYDQYNMSIPWNQGSNLDVISNRVSLYECPSSESLVAQNGGIEGGPLDYAMCKGDSSYLCFDGSNPRGPFDINSETTILDVRDGLSNTIFFGEAASDSNIPAAAT